MKVLQRCNICLKYKNVSNFYTQSRGELKGRCKRCYHLYYKQNYGKSSQEIYGWCKQWRKKHPDKVRERAWKKQGIIFTYEEYLRLKAEQKDKCKICGKSESSFKVSIAVDHNHLTGKVRGLLCLQCNKAVGYFENVELRQNIIKYIEGV